MFLTSTLVGVVLLATIVIPGHVWRSYRSRFLVLAPLSTGTDGLLTLVIYGLWNLAITWPVLVAFDRDPLSAIAVATDVPTLANAVRTHGWLWGLQLLVAPVILATLIAYIERKAWIPTLLRKAGLMPLPRHAQAFDQAFVKHLDAMVMVTVRLKDGSLLYGGWDADAAASTNTAERDVYLSSLYVLSEETGELEPDLESTGILIRGTEISYMIFSDQPEPVMDEDGDDEDDAVGDQAQTAPEVGHDG
jgi:hypothetical protein